MSTERNRKALASSWLALFLLWAGPIVATEPHWISLDKVVLDLAGVQFQVSAVVDARTEKFCLGLVQKGIGNRRVPAQLEGGLEVALMQLIQRSQALFKSTGPAYVLQVHLLQVYEVTYTGKEIAMTELDVSFLEPLPDGNYRELYRTGNTQEKNGVDVTGLHDRNIANALSRAMQIFQDRLNQQSTWNYSLPATDLRLPGRASSYPAQQQLSAQAFFYSFENFRDLVASKSAKGLDYMDLEEKQGHVKAKPQWKSGYQIDENPIWALSDGQAYYIKLGRSYYPLEKADDGSFIFWAPSIRNVTAAGLFGGIVGGLVGGLLMNGIGSEKGPPVAYRLDMNTGAIHPESTLKNRRIESRLLVYCSRFNPEETRLEVVVDGQTRCSLGAGEYTMVHLAPELTEVKVCLLQGIEEFCQEVSLEVFYTEFLLARVKRDGSLDIEKPNSNIELDIRMDIEAGRIREVESK
ncbi:MAG: hypothetical protein H6555_07335 [Lewinellaceae bacterium]|nr:hypothetical protein [Lewinellaceae bacterium]